jgi:hypothetical protein
MRIIQHASNIIGGREISLVVVNHIIGGHERAKHIDIRKHFAHEVIQNRNTRLIRVPTDKQLADIFTKALPFPQFERCLMGLMSGDLKPKGP